MNPKSPAGPTDSSHLHEHSPELFSLGYQAGIRWAKHRATAAEVEALVRNHPGRRDGTSIVRAFRPGATEEEVVEFWRRELWLEEMLVKEAGGERLVEVVIGDYSAMLGFVAGAAGVGWSGE